ncbi:MAG: hypothetical protein A2066_00100 [Bacteroidetes bacterium GWB2_41_8]|nr:MAG: hypothetical protein A2066_00100 [Bacteroidetes bacterium GWB2_41_8]
MKVDFYTNNEQKAPTVEHYLFSDEYAVMMNGQYIEQDGKWYQVTGILMPDDKVAALDVLLNPANRRPVQK